MFESYGYGFSDSFNELPLRKLRSLHTYFFRARESNFLVAAEEQSKNLESQLRGLIRTGEEEGRSYSALLLLLSS